MSTYGLVLSLPWSDLGAIWKKAFVVISLCFVSCPS